MFIVLLLILQSYIWPTDATQLLTSSFSEPRENRYHTGIDIRTYNRVGFKCFAISNGYVYRIKTSVYGYGKVLYFKLDDGKIAVYAHLNGFNRTLDHFVKSYQKKMGRYEVDIYFKKNQFRYNKGNILAYTGSSGVGTPHLHFEIRENMTSTINPLLFYPNFKDNFRPEVVELAAISLDSTSLVNGSNTIQYFPVTQENDSTYYVDEIIKLSGKMGFAFYAFDRTASNQIPTGIQEAQLYLNDSLIFDSNHKKIQFKYNRNANFDTNLFINKNHNRKYKNLFYENRFKTSFNELNPIQGIINSNLLPQIVNEFKAVFFDFKQNKTIVKGNILVRELQLLHDVYDKPFKLDNDHIPLLLNKTLIAAQEIEFAPIFEKEIQSESFWKMDQQNMIMSDFFKVELQEESLYKDVQVYLMRIPNGVLSDGIIETEIIHFLPNHLKTKNSFKISTLRPLNKYEGVFEYSGSKRKWNNIQLKKDDQNRSYFNATSMNTYAILSDSVPPVIYSRIRKDAQGNLYISVKDDLSGIYDEDNFLITMNGQKLVGEYDFETDEIKIDQFFLLKSRKINIVLRDNVGNEIKKILTF